VLNLIRRDPALRDRLKQTVEEGYDAVVQSHACLGHHSAENRLCGMLLRARQMLSQNRIPFDHGTIGDILTYHPVYVTRLMKKLSRAGLIEVGRGHIVIIDPAALARRACDCYDWLTRKILPV
jgi:CRP-like cAMP-binding protein